MKLKTRHVPNLQIEEKEIPIAYITTSQKDKAGRPLPLPGRYWTLSSPASQDGDIDPETGEYKKSKMWAYTAERSDVMVPMFRYRVNGDLPILMAAMLELGVLATEAQARLRLDRRTKLKDPPDICHIFVSDLFPFGDDLESPDGHVVYCGISFQFPELPEERKVG